MQVFHYEYTIKPSRSSSHHFYLVEIETDEIGTMERPISKPLTIDELVALKKQIILISQCHR